MSGSLANFSAICAAVLAASCAAPGQPNQPAEEFRGFGDLVLGSTFETTMSQVDAREFNPAGLANCLEDMPLKGCFLPPANQLSTFKRIDGIPFGLQLEFNKSAVLTDITLKYARRRSYDDDLNPVAATISKDECREIADRAVDWIAKTYGPFVAKKSAQPGGSERTKAGNVIPLDSTSDDTGFTALGEVPMPNGRKVAFFSHYLMILDEPDCNVNISFEEPESVERRPM